MRRHSLWKNLGVTVFIPRTVSETKWKVDTLLYKGESNQKCNYFEKFVTSPFSLLKKWECPLLVSMMSPTFSVTNLMFFRQFSSTWRDWPAGPNLTTERLCNRTFTYQNHGIVYPAVSKLPPTAICSHCSWLVFGSSTLQLVDFSNRHFAVGGFSLGGIECISP